MGQAEPKIGRGYVWERKHSSLHATHGRANPAYSLRFVPITEDGRLSAKEILSRKNLSLAQDRYGEMMKPFGFERGEKGSLAVHDTPKEYYGRVAQTNKEIENLVVKGLLGTDWKKTAENAINALKSIKTTEKANEYKLDRIEKRVGFKLEAENGTLKQRNENLERYREKRKVH